MQPRIAVPADILTEPTNILHKRNASFVSGSVIDSLVKSGATPVIIPCTTPEHAGEYSDLYDGIVFTGGVDVDPTFFGEDPHPGLGMTFRKRDLMEFALLKEARKHGKAILGICRGTQLINVGLGGTLYQDLSEDDQAWVKHGQQAPGNLPTHHIATKPNSLIADLVGERAFVNSRHHPALRKIAPALIITAQAEDGVPEAVESRENNQILGVQWHPENMFKHDQNSQRIFADLVSRARDVAARGQQAD